MIKTGFSDLFLFSGNGKAETPTTCRRKGQKIELPSLPHAPYGLGFWMMSMVMMIVRTGFLWSFE